MSHVTADWYTLLANSVAEKTTKQITGVIQDEAGNALGSTVLTALTLTLYPKATPATKINARDQQNVLNANGVTVDASGNLVWTATPLDNVVVNTALTEEQHIALFEYTWAAGAKGGKHLIEFTVTNLPTVS